MQNATWLSFQPNIYKYQKKLEKMFQTREKVMKLVKNEKNPHWIIRIKSFHDD